MIKERGSAKTINAQNRRQFNNCMSFVCDNIIRSELNQQIPTNLTYTRRSAFIEAHHFPLRSETIRNYTKCLTQLNRSRLTTMVRTHLTAHGQVV